MKNSLFKFIKLNIKKSTKETATKLLIIVLLTLVTINDLNISTEDIINGIINIYIYYILYDFSFLGINFISQYNCDLDISPYLYYVSLFLSSKILNIILLSLANIVFSILFDINIFYLEYILIITILISIPIGAISSLIILIKDINISKVTKILNTILFILFIISRRYMTINLFNPIVIIFFLVKSHWNFIKIFICVLFIIISFKFIKFITTKFYKI